MIEKNGKLRMELSRARENILHCVLHKDQFLRLREILQGEEIDRVRIRGQGLVHERPARGDRK